MALKGIEPGLTLLLGHAYLIHESLCLLNLGLETRVNIFRNQGNVVLEIFLGAQG